LILADLQAKLQSRIEDRCGAAPTLDSLEAALDHARYEYSRYVPHIKTKTFTLPLNEVRVSLTDDQGNPEDVVFVEGVYIKQSVPSTPLGQGTGSLQRSSFDYDEFETSGNGYLRELPSVEYMRGRYRELYSREVTFYRNFHELVVVRPSLMETVEGIVLYGTAFNWDALPTMEERYILDRALAEYIDSHLVSDAGGIIRIPTPNGSFEFDGGRVLLSLRDKLIDGCESHLSTRMSIIASG